MTPIHVNHFHKLLESDPNCPLVDSICEGLKSGLWPWAVTFNLDAPSIVDNACLQKVKDPRHLQFMKEQRDEEIKLNCFSSAFSTLLPGMMSIPLWVVLKPHSDKWCLVVDHSTGNYSPNSFISPDDTGVHLDTLHVLRKALLKVRVHHGDVHLILFKTDISQAYWHLPVHPLWQMCQSRFLILIMSITTTISATKELVTFGLPSLALSYGLLLLLCRSLIYLHTLMMLFLGSLLTIFNFTLPMADSFLPNKPNCSLSLTM